MFSCGMVDGEQTRQTIVGKLTLQQDQAWRLSHLHLLCVLPPSSRFRRPTSVHDWLLLVVAAGGPPSPLQILEVFQRTRGETQVQVEMSEES